MRKKREIIYVDASIKKEKATIYLIHQKKDVQKDTVIVLKFDKKFVSTSQNAEEMAILLGVSYADFNGLKNCIILSDNQSATTDESLNEILKKHGLKCSWIPREINLADNIEEKEPYKDKDRVINIFSKIFFFHINQKKKRGR